MFRQKNKEKKVIFINRLFVAEVKRQLALRKWTSKDLAKATGYKVSTIYAYMSGQRDSDVVEKAIAVVLDIEH